MLTQDQFASLRRGDHVIIDLHALAEVSRQYEDAGYDFALRADSDAFYAEDLESIGRYGEGGTWFTTLYSGKSAIVQNAYPELVSALDAYGADEEEWVIDVARNENAAYLTLTEEEACAALTLV